MRSILFMSRVIAGILFLLTVTPAAADWFHRLVGYKCDTENNQVILTYRGAYNEAGEEMMRNKGPQEWDPWSLSKTNDDGSFGTRTTVQGQCRLKEGLYEIEIGPAPMDKNISGPCGANMSAWARVRKGSKLILDRHDFEAYCHPGDPVTTEIVIRSGGREVVMKKMPRYRFLR
jgi:hypothetical protein